MTRSYEIALFILQKVSCFLSATGSLMIISQVSRSKFNRSKPQQRLILGLSVSDTILSIIWILTPLFMPSDSGAVWAIGNQTTCNIQGFIVTLFNASAILYMCALQLQYLLTIRYSWTEGKIRGKVEPYMHAIPWCLGLSAAITQLALKLYNPADWDCWIAPYPADCTSSHEVKKGGTGLTETDCIRGDNAEIYRWSFFFAPLWVAIAFCIVAMILIFQSVRNRERTSLRHSSRRYTQNVDGSVPQSVKIRKSMMVRTQKVKTQCFLYAGAFFSVWTFPTIARLIQLLGGTIHPIIGVLAGTFIGSQGFFNAIIYFRPRYKELQQRGMLAKICTLMSMTLLFCCHDAYFGRGSKYDSDYMQPPNISGRGSLNPAGSSKNPDSAGVSNESEEGNPARKTEEDDFKRADADIEVGLQKNVPERTRVSFQTEPTTNMDEIIAEDDPTASANGQ